MRTRGEHPPPVSPVSLTEWRRRTALSAAASRAARQEPEQLPPFGGLRASPRGLVAILTVTIWLAVMILLVLR